VGARQELNKLHVFGSLVVAAFVGGLAGSWAVFATVAAVLIVGGIYSGDIRWRGRRTPRRALYFDLARARDSRFRARAGSCLPTQTSPRRQWRP
jgi:hypothetical protein